MKNIINRAFMAKKKILFVLAAVMFCAASTSAQCVYDHTTGVIKIYKHDGSLKGDFSVSATKKVKFAQGNLQYNSDEQKWQFAENQWEYIGDTDGNKNITEDGKANNTGIADLFCWVGASSIWDTELKKHGLTSSMANEGTTDGFGNSKSDKLKDDWGSLMGTGWRTLTADEWRYLFNTTNSSDPAVGRQGNRYAKAIVHGVNGMILLPDGWTPSSVSLSSINTADAAFDTNTVSDENWTILAGEGCVFLPAAGSRNGTTIYGPGVSCGYWSSSPDTSLVTCSCFFQATSGTLSPSGRVSRRSGYAVRLVKDVVVTP